NLGDTAFANFSLVVHRIEITTPSLFNGAVGSGYTNQLGATNGKPPYAWTLNSGSLPGGMGISSAGVLSGVPATSGTYSLSVSVTDSNLVSTNKSFSLLINPKPFAPPFHWAVKAGGGGADQSFSVSVNGSGIAIVAGDFYSPTVTFGGTTLT